jgi:hypothetical protein
VELTIGNSRPAAPAPDDAARSSAMRSLMSEIGGALRRVEEPGALARIVLFVPNEARHDNGVELAKKEGQ